jgi:hypothetical protein
MRKTVLSLNSDKFSKKCSSPSVAQRIANPLPHIRRFSVLHIDWPSRVDFRIKQEAIYLQIYLFNLLGQEISFGRIRKLMDGIPDLDLGSDPILTISFKIPQQLKKLLVYLARILRGLFPWKRRLGEFEVPIYIMFVDPKIFVGNYGTYLK